MKLDATDLRYLSQDDFRVLTAVEMGSKNHEIVPSTLIANISGLRSGGVNKCLGNLAKRNLVARVQGAKYDGYRLTYGGYDFLAVRAFAKRNTVHSVGNQIGTGKESDIYVVADEEGEQSVLKIHRLGRISFRSIKSKRDYLRKGQHASWMYMSRLAAVKEYAFMKVLHEHGFPVPKPVDQARHCLVMELIDAFPLRQVAEVADPGALYSQLMDLIVRLARAGLIHGDFNEFNILLTEPEGKPILIDFPQMVSTEHENAEYYFNRDVACIRTFFKRRFRYESQTYPKFRSTLTEAGEREFRLDVEVEASGFSHKEARQLAEYMELVDGEGGGEEEDQDDGDPDDDAEDGKDGEDEQQAAGDAHMDDEDLTTADTEAEAATDDVAPKAVDGQDHDRDSVSSSASAPSDIDDPPSLDKLTVHETRDVSATVASDLARRRANQGRRHHGRGKVASGAKRRGPKAKHEAKVGVSDALSGW